MTQIFLETLSRLGYPTKLVDRRFSKTVAEVGRPSVLKGLRGIGIFLRLIIAILRHKPRTCIFFVTTRPGSLIVDWLLSEVLGLFRIRTVAYLHTIGFQRLSAKSKVWNFVIGRLFANCTDIVTLSPLLNSDLDGFAANAHIHSVPNTILENMGGESISRQPAEPHFVFISNLIPEKGAKDFLLLAQKMRKYPTASFSLIGATADEVFVEELQGLIETIGMGDRIKILGPVYGEMKWKLLSHATALVFPSSYAYEAQPLTILEALHVGTPIVAYRAGAIDDCIVTNSNGWVCAQGDVDALFEKLKSLMADEVLWEAMSASCREIFANKFSRDAYERNWHEILRETI